MTESMRIIEQMLSIMEDDHYKCDLESDDDCDLTDEGGYQVKHQIMREAKQLLEREATDVRRFGKIP